MILMCLINYRLLLSLTNLIVSGAKASSHFMGFRLGLSFCFFLSQGAFPESKFKNHRHYFITKKNIRNFLLL